MDTSMKRLWLWFLAYFRLSDTAICEMSQGREWYNDYHDYPDDIQGTPDHFVLMTCKRCGKGFKI